MSSDSMPAAIDAEKTILGAMLLDANAMGQAADLMPEDFYLDGHRRVFTAMREMATQGDALDLVTLSNYLQSQGGLSACGGAAYLATLPDGVPRRPSIAQYVRIVREKADLRRLIEVCTATIAQAHEQVAAATCMETIENALLDLEARRQGNETYHIGDFMPQAIAFLRQEAEANGLVGFTTGINRLDELTTGIRKGELWLVGGLPNSGKTPLGVQIGMENSRNGTPVMIFSLEMSRFQLSSRIIAESGVVPAHKLRRPKTLSVAEWGNLMTEERTLSALPLWVNDASQIRLSELLMRAKLAIKTRNVGLVIVDYLMLIDAPGRELRHQADAIAKGLKALAKSEGVAVVLLSQFRRPQNINDRPNLTWFKESGGIEATANTALGVYRPVSEDDGITATGRDEILILKQREGERGSIPVVLNEKQLRFYDREEGA